MEVTIRLGGRAAQQYPLPIDQAAEWQQSNQSWQTTILLPDLPKGYIIVPSFVLPNRDYSYRFEAQVNNEPGVPLLTVPQGNMYEHSSKSLSTHIDCWHTVKKCQQVAITLVVSGELTLDDMNNSLTVLSARPLQIKIRAPQDLSVRARTPRLAHSQMLGPSNIRKGICSPTALAMAIDGPWPLAVAACRHRQTRSFGCWPLAIYWAGQRGHYAAVEVASNFDDALAVLQAGSPMVCSVNYKSGALTDAPQPQTSGHLVTLVAIEGNQALVYDPAAPTHESVPRRYDIEQFAQAWLHQRGAAYIFNP